MLIEALVPLRVKTPTGDIVMTPGEPVEFPREQGYRLLVKASGKVKETTRDWSPTWRELAALPAGLTAGDPRLPLLHACDNAYLNGNWEAFCHAAARVRSAVSEEGTR